MAVEQCEYRCYEQPAHGFWQSLGRFLQRFGKRLERWDQLAQQRQQLLAMDDHQLKDIGLSRADVEKIAGRRRFWYDPLRSGEQIDPRYRSNRKY